MIHVSKRSNSTAIKHFIIYNFLVVHNAHVCDGDGDGSGACVCTHMCVNKSMCVVSHFSKIASMQKEAIIGHIFIPK